jgi:hypothetical protein
LDKASASSLICSDCIVDLCGDADMFVTLCAASHLQVLDGHSIAEPSLLYAPAADVGIGASPGIAHGSAAHFK